VSRRNHKISDWRGKRVWIIGASSGIGAALTKSLNLLGAKLAVSARSKEKLAALANVPGELTILPLDVTEPGEILSAAEDLKSKWQQVDVIFYLTGTHAALRAWEITPENSRRLLATNLQGAFDTVSAALDGLLANDGALVLTASVAGYRGLPTASIYGPTKAALINFAETLYLDLVPQGKSVFLLNPGFVDTPLTRKNQFPMPALITIEEAAAETLAGMAKGRFEIHFPRRFTRIMRLLRLLPYRWYFPLVHRATGL
jgi:short-subunit dehydrogenase